LKHGAHTVLSEVSLQLQAGRIHGLIGANGAGKSSLLACLSGDIPHPKITLDGLPLPAPTPLARRRVVLPQSSHVAFDLPVREVVEMGSLGENVDIAPFLAATDLLHLQHQPYPRLSGGEKTRVQLARNLAQLSVCQAPAYWLLDEPSAALDPLQKQLLQRMLQQQAQAGVGILLIAHDVNWTLACCDDLTLLKAGKVFWQGESRALSAEVLSDLYGVRYRVVEVEGMRFFVGR
jgi:iron complex transport system ATP-binding protein